MPPVLAARQQRKRSMTVESASRRKLSFSNCDFNNTTEVNYLYHECVEHIHKGLHPVSRQTAIKLAAIECFVLFGPYRDGIESSISAERMMPKEYTKAKEHEKNIREQYRELLLESESAAMRNYCDICRSLPTYGLTFFMVKEPVGSKLINRLFGVNTECVMSVDAKSKIVLKSWPLEQLRRWGASPTTFNIDFGDYQEGYYSVKTLEGERIKRLIAEFVDIILKKKQIIDSFGLEGDEGAIMIEDNISPAQVKQIVFPQIEAGDGSSVGTVGTPTNKFPDKSFPSLPLQLEKPHFQEFAEKFFRQLPEKLSQLPQQEKHSHPLPEKNKIFAPLDNIPEAMEFSRKEQTTLHFEPSVYSSLSPQGNYSPLTQSSGPFDSEPMDQEQAKNSSLYSQLIKQPSVPQTPIQPPPQRAQQAIIDEKSSPHPLQHRKQQLHIYKVLDR